MASKVVASQRSALPMPAASRAPFRTWVGQRGEGGRETRGNGREEMSSGVCVRERDRERDRERERDSKSARASERAREHRHGVATPIKHQATP